MTTATSEISIAAEIPGRVALLERTLEALRIEHAAGAPARQMLVDAIAQAEAKVARLANELGRLKAEAKQYKRQVDDWKQWFHTLPGINRALQLAKLQGEIQWRSAAIAATEAQIAALGAAQIAAQDELERARHQLAALDAGVFSRPISEDPRLLAVMAELDAARAA
jgi:chromosome segregation ATPase